jgi:hypothetical protein
MGQADEASSSRSSYLALPALSGALSPSRGDQQVQTCMCSLERALAVGQHTRHPVTGVYSNKVADAGFVHFDSLHITHALTHPHVFTASCLACLKHPQTLSYRAIPQPACAKQSYRHPSSHSLIHACPVETPHLHCSHGSPCHLSSFVP